MKIGYIGFVLVLFATYFTACNMADDGATTPREPEVGDTDVTLVSIGDSITMGIQSSGLNRSDQEHCYAYLVAIQMGLTDEFEQPWISESGVILPPFSSPIIFSSSEGISAEFGELDVSSIGNPFSLFTNYFLNRPYSNLAVGGARLFDVRNTTSGENSLSENNLLFDFVLRRRGTQLEQALSINPELIFLSIGANDVLHAVSKGTDQGITSVSDFNSEYRAIVTEITNSGADLILGSIPEYLPLVEGLDAWKQDGFWYLPSADNITQLNRDTVLYFEESDVSHLLLYGWFEILNSLKDGGTLGTSADNPLAGEYTLTALEYSTIEERISAFNGIINQVQEDFNHSDHQVRIVNLSTFWHSGIIDTDYSGHYIVAAQDNTIFSLDGIHPNNLGQVMIANSVIDALNSLDQYSGENSINKLNINTFSGQYSSLSLRNNRLKPVQFNW